MGLRKLEDMRRPVFLRPTPGAPGRQGPACILSTGFMSIQKPDHIPRSQGRSPIPYPTPCF